VSEEFLELRLRDLLERVAAPQPEPGGGAVLALVAAMAAGVVAMAARACDSDDWPEAPDVAEQAEALRVRAAPLAQLDAEIYERALASDDPDAYARAAEPPLEIGRVATEIGELAAHAASRLGENLRSDALVAAALASAVARAATRLVAVNVPGDDPRLREACAQAEAAERAAARAFSR
jgi:formiminotetrahydrofolate cyclodeaminase